MGLKTDYKDAIFEGRRKYKMIDNVDGTVSFDDVTDYTQAGTQFGAADVNAITGLVNNSLQVVSWDKETGTLITKSVDGTGDADE